MKNKILINKLKDNAELAMAAYGYFHLIGKKIENDRKKYGDKADKPITLHDILDMTYKKYIAVKSNPHKSDDEIKIGTLDGDFSPTQVKNFFDKYDLLDFYPKFDTKNNKQKEGFHACLFQDRESKELIRKLN